MVSSFEWLCGALIDSLWSYYDAGLDLEDLMEHPETRQRNETAAYIQGEMDELREDIVSKLRDAIQEVVREELQKGGYQSPQ